MSSKVCFAPSSAQGREPAVPRMLERYRKRGKRAYGPTQNDAAALHSQPPRQCELETLRMLVTGWPPNCGGPAAQRAMTSSRSASALLRTIGRVAPSPVWWRAGLACRGGQHPPQRSQGERIASGGAGSIGFISSDLRQFALDPADGGYRDGSSIVGCGRRIQGFHLLQLMAQAQPPPKMRQTFKIQNTQPESTVSPTKRS